MDMIYGMGAGWDQWGWMYRGLEVAWEGLGGLGQLVGWELIPNI